MTYFQCDYASGAHPKIIKNLVATNEVNTLGYGNDRYCKSAAQKIKKACDTPNANVHFLVGGTQTNSTVIYSILRPHQGVISADSGHIAVHETGAIEAKGHKVLTLPSVDGKITAKQISDCFDMHKNDPVRFHTVQPGMVYISFPTETGTLYTKKELEELSQICKDLNLPLFVDGARLGYGLMSKECDITLQDLAKLCDIFYIGGTKCGALFGEAVVITNDTLKKDFKYIMKQCGALLAKGRMLGVQFDTLFTDNLYFEICKSAVDYAVRIKKAFEEKGVNALANSQTNQQFFALSDEYLEILSKKYLFEVYGKTKDNLNYIRVCTSWASKKEDVDELIKDIKSL
ncbi:low specificity L-threonine aldolase [Campylobacter blaseri]|uniref:Low specificity L-threonine aldolase n=1 Tax=Campylobacter blaseri TaxID=2042961 RepID=A0A2P8R196_9BACT|nr:aminotransferase class V-fold PLP-dependent enzyme [Campylobacter blaseri]PSM52262.1 low specificity L-threonine aldolase [Campylobacter blaseri]PSM54028.1 low specificity L-threonine aldolase [Campylobacter blaseri]QKF85469.1 low specificity L-threonine aldolase [Campylobacter blaseri]